MYCAYCVNLNWITGMWMLIISQRNINTVYCSTLPRCKKWMSLLPWKSLFCSVLFCSVERIYAFLSFCHTGFTQCLLKWLSPLMCKVPHPFQPLEFIGEMTNPTEDTLSYSRHHRKRSGRWKPIHWQERNHSILLQVFCVWHLCTCTLILNWMLKRRMAEWNELSVERNK